MNSLENVTKGLCFKSYIKFRKYLMLLNIQVASKLEGSCRYIFYKLNLYVLF